MKSNEKSHKELTLDEKLYKLAEDLSISEEKLPLKAMKMLATDAEIEAIQDYANNVSIARLGFNDHGPVHMRMVCRNALKMLKILHEAGIKTSLENEGAGTFDDSVVAVTIASFLHDAGMTVGRSQHELYSGIIAYNIINRVVEQLLPDAKDLCRRVIIRSMALEGIVGHMGTRPIHSIEAGLILIADGCDMTKGRARIAMELNNRPVEGDIHKYSANSIEKVYITQGVDRPIKIEVHMQAEVGFFQVEEVLMQKISQSPAKQLVELHAGVEGQEMKRYL